LAADADQCRLPGGITMTEQQRTITILSSLIGMGKIDAAAKLHRLLGV